MSTSRWILTLSLTVSSMFITPTICFVEAVFSMLIPIRGHKLFETQSKTAFRASDTSCVSLERLKTIKARGNPYTNVG